MPILIVGIVLVILTIIISTTFGYSNISATETFKIVINHFYKVFDSSSFPVNSEITILMVRLPRVLGAALAGIGLTISGIIFQSILKNPMAEPYILGVSSGAALGAAISIVTNITIPFIHLSYTTSFFALSGALVASSAVIFISGNSYNTNRIILYGVSFNFLLSSLLTLLISLNYKESSDIIFWTMGSFTTMNYQKILILLITIGLGSFIVLFYRRELNLFTMGLPIAQSLGLDIKKYRVILLTVASIITGIIVSFTGIIGFVGLIIPHLARLFVGSEHKKVIYLSLPLGAIFMVISDTLARSIITSEIPVGVVTSIIGAPVFIYLLKKKGNV